MRLLAIVLTILGVVVPNPAGAGPVTATVRTLTRPGTAASAAIIYAEPLDAPASRRPGVFTLTQKDKTFRPHILAVPIGSTVEFPNQDSIFHNVFSLSWPQPFDLGLYRAGSSRSQTFPQPGEYRVFCNIHPQMTALILVVGTPYVARPGPTAEPYWICRRADTASPQSQGAPRPPPARLSPPWPPWTRRR